MFKKARSATFEVIGGNHGFAQYFGTRSLYHSGAVFKVNGDTCAYVFGGTRQGDFTNQTFVYNINQNLWKICNIVSPPEHTPSPRGMCAFAQDESRLFIFGGRNQSEHFHQFFVMRLRSETEIEWERIDKPFCPEARWLSSLCFHDNKLYLCGGTSGETQLFNDVWCYDIEEGQWDILQTHGPRPSTICGHTALAIGNKMYIIGGLEVEKNVVGDGPSSLFGANIKSPRSKGLFSLSGASSSMPENHTDLFYHKCIHVLDFGSKIWRELDVKNGPGARFCHMTAHIGDGRIVLVGGDRSQNDDFSGLSNHSCIYEYDSEENKWDTYKVQNLREYKFVCSELETTKGMLVLPCGVGTGTSSSTLVDPERQLLFLGGAALPNFLRLRLKFSPRPRNLKVSIQKDLPQVYRKRSLSVDSPTPSPTFTAEPWPEHKVTEHVHQPVAGRKKRRTSLKMRLFRGLGGYKDEVGSDSDASDL